MRLFFAIVAADLAAFPQPRAAGAQSLGFGVEHAPVFPRFATSVGRSFTVDLAGHFRDRSGGRLVFAAAAQDPGVVVACQGSIVTVTGALVGMPRVVVAARNAAGATARGSFVVDVHPREFADRASSQAAPRSARSTSPSSATASTCSCFSAWGRPRAAADGRRRPRPSWSIGPSVSVHPLAARRPRAPPRPRWSRANRTATTSRTRTRAPASRR